MVLVVGGAAVRRAVAAAGAAREEEKTLDVPVAPTTLLRLVVLRLTFILLEVVVGIVRRAILILLMWVGCLVLGVCVAI